MSFYGFYLFILRLKGNWEITQTLCFLIAGIATVAFIICFIFYGFYFYESEDYILFIYLIYKDFCFYFCLYVIYIYF